MAATEEIASTTFILAAKLSLITRIVPSPIIGGQIGKTVDRSSEETPAERRIGHKADPVFAADVESLVFHLAFPERIFRLQGRDRMSLRGATDRFRSGLGQGDMADLSFLHEVSHPPNGLFDRDIGIDPMLVEQVDHYSIAQPLQ